MSSDEKKAFKCPECGGKGVPTGKTWANTSPMVLMGGKIIIMGIVQCEECENKFRRKLKEIPLESEEAKEYKKDKEE